MISMKSKVVIEGQKFYYEHLKVILEPERIGEFVSMEMESGQYFLDRTGGEAISKGNMALPNKMLFWARIEFPFAYKMGFRETYRLKNKRLAVVNYNSKSILP